jgi:MtrB/PioB family decaheme-associated outer membrane protein
MERARIWTVVTALLGAPALAQDDFDLGAAPVKKPPPLFTSTLELGLGWQSDSSFSFNRYGGNRDQGLFPILNGAFSRREAWDSGQTTFFDGRAVVASEDMRALFARYGQQGQWQVSGLYTAFTRAHTETARTPFTGAGTRQLSLPANWVGSNQSSRFTTLEQNLKPLELKTEWRTIGGDFVLAPAETGYELRFHVDRRRREGLKEHGITFGHEANFPVGIFFPLPIDYVSHRFTSSLSYVDARLQWSAKYELAKFDSRIDSVIVPNPYARSPGQPWPAGAFAGYPFAFGQYSLPPETTAHVFSLAGGYALTPGTRLTARLSYALNTQNDQLLPYSANPRLVVIDRLPRAAFDGDVRKTFAALAITARESDAFEFSGGYTFEDRQNKSSRDLYSYIPNDAQDQAQPFVPGVSRYIRFNLPRSVTTHKLKAEAAHRFTPRTRLSVAFNNDFKSRTYEAVAHSHEYQVKAKLLSAFAAGSGWVSYSYADRDGSEYRDDLTWNESHTLNYINAGPQNASIEHPSLRKFHLADRIRREGRGGLTVDATPAVAINAAAGFARDTYANSPLGLQSSRSLLIDLDVSITVPERVTASVFHSFESIRFFQKGYYIATLNLFNPNFEWTARNRDRAHTTGVRADFTVIPETLTVEAKAHLSRGRTAIAVQAQPVVPLAAVAALPDTQETTHHLGLNAQFRLRPETAIKAGYTFERRRSNDWQYDSVGLTPVTQLLGSGILPPRYAVHVLSLSALYQF